MGCRSIFYFALTFLPAATTAQTDVNEKMESGIANARIIAARKAASAVTAQQCLADISSWDAKNHTDLRANVEQPNWWYRKLSTEEIVRLASESTSCSTALRHAHQEDDSRLMNSYGRMFENELLGRAEAVLIDHHLMHEYLLKSSE
jgi:ethanolamine ammonia-lyase small subunit